MQAGERLAMSAGLTADAVTAADDDGIGDAAPA
jgi:hypothetical protein